MLHSGRDCPGQYALTDRTMLPSPNYDRIPMDEWLGLLGDFLTGLIPNRISGATFVRYSILILISMTLIGFVWALLTGFRPELPGLVVFLLVQLLLFFGFFTIGRNSPK